MQGEKKVNMQRQWDCYSSFFYLLVLFTHVFPFSRNVRHSLAHFFILCTLQFFSRKHLPRRGRSKGHIGKNWTKNEWACVYGHIIEILLLVNFVGFKCLPEPMLRVWMDKWPNCLRNDIVFIRKKGKRTRKKKFIDAGMGIGWPR